VKFWDTSALVPLVIEEPATPAVRQLVADDPEVVVWMLTSVELFATLARLGRASEGLQDLVAGIRHDLVTLFRASVSVTHVEGVRRRAERLVSVHALSAADALQLGAALVASEDQPDQLDFVTLDRPLARCAQLEGFRVPQLVEA
jgi:predicted nucleic acid-binding protein